MKRKMNYGSTIIWAAMLVTVVRYIGAFVASDVGEISGNGSILLSLLMGVSGIGMGVLDVLGTAYLFENWRGMLPKRGDRPSNRFIIMTVFVVLAFITSLMILVPFTVSRITHQSMEEALGGKSAAALTLWALAVNFAPLILIGGVMTGGRMSLQSESQNAEATAKPQKAAAGSGTAPQNADLAFECPTCHGRYKSQNALNAHMKKHNREVANA